MFSAKHSRLAIQTGEPQRLVPVAAARAEAVWIAGRLADITAEIDRAWPAAIAHQQPWDLGELSWWLHVAGEHRQVPITLARPFALMLAGEHREAADQWRAVGCPLWSAYALARSPHPRDAQECLDILDRIGAPAVRRAVLRDRHAHGLPVPRGPRPASRAHPCGLTAREVEVPSLLGDGLSYAEVAERLILSEKTVASPDMSAGTPLARAQLSFWRIMDVPFGTCAAVLDSGQLTGPDRGRRAGRPLACGSAEHDPAAGTCQVQIRLSRAPLRMRLHADHWSSAPPRTALELIPCGPVRPGAAYLPEHAQKVRLHARCSGRTRCCRRPNN